MRGSAVPYLYPTAPKVGESGYPPPATRIPSWQSQPPSALYATQQQPHAHPHPPSQAPSPYYQQAPYSTPPPQQTPHPIASSYQPAAYQYSQYNHAPSQYPPQAPHPTTSYPPPSSGHSSLLPLPQATSQYTTASAVYPSSQAAPKIYNYNAAPHVYLAASPAPRPAPPRTFSYQNLPSVAAAAPLISRWRDTSSRDNRSRASRRSRSRSPSSSSSSRSRSGSKSRSRSRSGERGHSRRAKDHRGDRDHRESQRNQSSSSSYSSSSSSSSSASCASCGSTGHTTRFCNKPRGFPSSGTTSSPMTSSILGGVTSGVIKCRSVRLDLANMPPQLSVEHVLGVASYFGRVLEVKMGRHQCTADVSFVDPDHARLMMETLWEQRIVMPISWASHIIFEKSDPSVLRLALDHHATRTAYLYNLPHLLFDTPPNAAAEEEFRAFLSERSPLPHVAVQLLPAYQSAFVHFAEVKSAAAFLTALKNSPDFKGWKLGGKYGKENSVNLDNPNYPLFLENAFPFITSHRQQPRVYKAPPPPCPEFATVYLERFPSTATVQDALRLASKYGAVLDAYVEEHMERCVVHFERTESAWTMLTEEENDPENAARTLVVLGEERVKVRWAPPSVVGEHRLREFVKQESQRVWGEASRSLWLWKLPVLWEIPEAKQQQQQEQQEQEEQEQAKLKTEKNKDEAIGVNAPDYTEKKNDDAIGVNAPAYTEQELVAFIKEHMLLQPGGGGESPLAECSVDVVMFPEFRLAFVDLGSVRTAKELLFRIDQTEWRGATIQARYAKQPKSRIQLRKPPPPATSKMIYAGKV